MTVHEVMHDVTFGDCDPAGIVFYPNIYRWLDRCFHDWLRQFGGHAMLCRELGLAGMGLREATAKFRSPIRDGDCVAVQIESLDWSEKTLTLNYVGRCGDRVAFTGQEQRALFVMTPAGMRAGDMDLLKAALGQHGQG